MGCRQMQHLAAMGGGSDVAFSNWTRFPLADMEMGSAGKPFAFRGFITPMLNWVFLALTTETPKAPNQ